MSNNNIKKRFYKIVTSLWLGSCLIVIGDMVVYAVLPLYTGAVGISLSDVGILFGISSIARLLFNGVVGYLFDFGNQKKLFAASLFLGTFAYFLFGFCSGFVILFIARILWGISWSGIIIGGTNILIEETTVENRGKLIGLHYFWISVGSILGYVIGGFLSEKIGFQITMVVSAFFALGGAFFVLVFLPNVETHKKEKISFANLKKNYAVKLDLTLLLYAAIFCISRFITLGFIASLLSIVIKEKISPFMVFIGVAALTGLIGGVRTLLETCFNPITGYIADKFKNRLYLIIIVLLFGVAGLFIITLAPPYMTILGLLLCTVPSGCIPVLVRTLVGDYAAEKNNQGRSMGFVLTVGDLASAIGPIFAFRILFSINMDIIFRSMAIALIILIVVIIIFIRYNYSVLNIKKNHVK